MADSSQQEDTQRGAMWWCCKCKRLLGVTDRAGRLWLAADIFNLAQRYSNCTRVECRCGRINVWYWHKPETLRKELEQAGK